MYDVFQALAIPSLAGLAGIAWIAPGVAIGILLLASIIYIGLTTTDAVFPPLDEENDLD